MNVALRRGQPSTHERIPHELECVEWQLEVAHHAALTDRQTVLGRIYPWLRLAPSPYRAMHVVVSLKTAVQIWLAIYPVVVGHPAEMLARETSPIEQRTASSR